MEKYEQPGVSVVSKVPNKAYMDNYDSIFRKTPETWVCTVADCHAINEEKDVICKNCGKVR